MMLQKITFHITGKIGDQKIMVFKSIFVATKCKKLMLESPDIMKFSEVQNEDTNESMSDRNVRLSFAQKELWSNIHSEENFH